MDVRRTGRIFGWLFIGTFVTSIPARLLFISGLGASWSDMRFIPGDTSTASLKLGAVLEFGLIVTQIGTAVVIYPLVRRQSETVSLGYVDRSHHGVGLRRDRHHQHHLSRQRGGGVGVSHWRRCHRARCFR